MSLKLVSLNIERSNHLDRVLPFLAAEAPDVVCLQELMEYDIPRFAQEFGPHFHFDPMTIHQAEGREGKMGVGIFSHNPFVATRTHYYRGKAGQVPTHIEMSGAVTEEEKGRSVSGMLLVAEIMHENALYRVGTVHFTWTAKGGTNDLQRADLHTLLELLEHEREIVFCGDFNAPRGGEIFSKIADAYADNVPSKYKTSIDATLHRNGRDRPEELADKMVDGLFTSPHYHAKDVSLVPGISDHCAIVATVTI
ncbi:MAG: endonuclease/exonuclease/phosphatase family protein [bacterium]